MHTRNQCKFTGGCPECNSLQPSKEKEINNFGNCIYCGLKNCEHIKPSKEEPESKCKHYDVYLYAGEKRCLACGYKFKEEPESKEDWEKEYLKKFTSADAYIRHPQDTINFIRSEKEKSFLEGKAFIGNSKREWYQRGFDEGKKETDDSYGDYANDMNKLLFDCEKETKKETVEKIKEGLLAEPKRLYSEFVSVEDIENHLKSII